MLKALKQLLDGVVAFFQVRPPSKSEERRRLIRLRCDYQVQCVVDQTTITARIADMGLNGMRIRINQKLKPGSKMFVYHPSRAADKVEEEYVLCEVRWCRRRRDSEELEAGLKYADITGNMRRSWVKFLLKELGFDERAIYTRRKLIRADTTMVGELHSDDGQRLEGVVVNLGAGGVLFESAKSFHPTCKVRLLVGPLGKLRALEVTGVILHIRPTPEGKLHTSIRFEDLKAAQVKLLGQYVVHLLRMISV